METRACVDFDHIVIGSGLAGLSSALRLADNGRVALVTKQQINDCNTRYAQGGIACVMDVADSFPEHVADTIDAGRRLCDKKVVKQIVEAGPAVIKELIELGAKFTTRGDLGLEDGNEEFDLGKEGGHKKRRVLHAGDITGAEVQRILAESCCKHPNITLLDSHIAIDLITTKRLALPGDDRCLGVYVLDRTTNTVKTLRAYSTTIATGGSGKVYLYTSNPDIACGGGIAMCYRANVPIANMEFFQFHPTILYHPQMRSFLISEAVRGEGAVLQRKTADGNYVEFMDSYHEMGSLAPRDVVARAIDHEMKRSGADCVFLDITHHDEATLKRRFPNIFAECLKAGINMAEERIPVVPAAHYQCGGVKTDINGFTGINGLYAVGEVACTGLHGANRLASNSLLEALVIAKFSANDIIAKNSDRHPELPVCDIPLWSCGGATDSDELVVLSHNWDEIRRFMWDYVGIVRTNKRLERAKARIKFIRKEIEKFYWDFLVTADLIELRNIASVAEIIIDSAMSRKESRGLHYNADYPELNPELDCVDTIIQYNKDKKNTDKMKNNLKVASYITEIVNRLQQAGYEAYIVGGAIRDLMLKRIPKDYDLSTSATPEQVKKVFGGRRARIIGRRFKLVHLYHGREIIEISTFRSTPSKTGRPKLEKFDKMPEKMIFHDNEYGTAKEDAFRRDFTVNALFFDPVAGKIIDHTGKGLNDIRDGIVRVIGDAELRFEEDPVRLLRALKLVGQYDFKLCEHSEKALRNSIELLSHASESRLSLELEKILKGTYCERIFTAFQQYGLLKYFLPNLAKEWDSTAAQYAMKLLAIRNKRIATGKYRDSISMAMACMSLPFVEQNNGSEMGNLWEYQYETTPELIYRSIKQIFAPHNMIKRLNYSAQKMLQLQTSLLDPEQGERVIRQKGYAHARELMIIQHEVVGNFAGIIERWPKKVSPPHRPPFNNNRRRKPRRPNSK
jgi:L-aspartate oxidase